MADIRIDRYDVDLSGTSGTFVITDVGDITRAFVRIVGSSRQDSAGEVGKMANAAPEVFGVRLEMTGTNEVTYTKQTTNTIKLMCEVWVYTGSVGGAYEFISRQRGSVDLGDNTFGSAPITGIVNRDDCVPLYTGYNSNMSNPNEVNPAVACCHLNAASEVVFERGDPVTNLICNYDVVEFVGSAWRVGCARSDSHDIGNQGFEGGAIVTMNTDSDGQSGSTFNVNNWATAMILQGTMEGDTSETGVSDTMMYFYPAESTTELVFALDNANSRNDGVAYAYIIQCDDLIVNRTYSDVIEGDNSYGVNLAGPPGYNYATPLSEMSLEWFPGTNGEATAFSRGALNAQIIDTGSAYEVQHWVHRQGNNVMATYAFVDMSGLVDSGISSAQVKRWNGSEWINVTVKGWDGNQWASVKFWNGSEWLHQK
jgi:hypothetical protein